MLHVTFRLAFIEFGWRRRAIETGCVLLFLVYCGFRFSAFHLSAAFGQSNDTRVYLHQASLSLSTPAFWTGLRPPVVPLVYKALGSDPHSIVAFQFALSLLSWGLLAGELARALRQDFLKILGFAAILVFSASTPIIVWDRVLLSESLSISLFAALAALALRCSGRWTWPRGTLLLITAVLWGFSRETNAWVLAAAAGLLLAAGLLWPARRRAAFLVASVLLGVFVLNDRLPDLSLGPRSPPVTVGASVEPDMSQRWVYPLLNVLAQRILTRPEAVAWFADRGMPVTPALLRKAGGWAWSGFYEDPELTEFRRWLVAQGRSTYVRYLCSRPLASIRESFDGMHALVTLRIATDATPGDFVPLLTGAVAEGAYPVRWALLSWTAAAMMSIAFGAAFWRTDRRWLVPAGLILLAYPHAAVVWFADALELGRHSVQMNVQLRVGMVLAVLFAVDALMAARAAKSS